MLTREERHFKEQEYNETFEGKIKEMRLKYPKHNYEILAQLAQLQYPHLFAAANGDFDDDFDVKQYIEPEEPEFENPADELAHRARVYSLEKDIPYEKASAIIMESDEDLAERYKMS